MSNSRFLRDKIGEDSAKVSNRTPLIDKTANFLAEMSFRELMKNKLFRNLVKVSFINPMKYKSHPENLQNVLHQADEVQKPPRETAKCRSSIR